MFFNDFFKSTSVKEVALIFHTNMSSHEKAAEKMAEIYVC